MARYKQISNVILNKKNYPAALISANTIGQIMDLPVHDAVSRVLNEQAEVLKEQSSVNGKEVVPSTGCHCSKQ